MRSPPFFSEFEGLEELASYNPKALVYFGPKFRRNRSRNARKRERKVLVKEALLKAKLEELLNK